MINNIEDNTEKLFPVSYCNYCHGMITEGEDVIVIDIDGNKYHYDCYRNEKTYIDPDFLDEDD